MPPGNPPQHQVRRVQLWLLFLLRKIIVATVAYISLAVCASWVAVFITMQRTDLSYQERVYRVAGIWRLSIRLALMLAVCKVLDDVRRRYSRSGSYIERQILIQIKRRVPNQIERKVLSQIKRQILSQIKRSVPSQIKRSVPSQIKRQILSQIKSRVPNQIKKRIVSSDAPEQEGTKGAPPLEGGPDRSDPADEHHPQEDEPYDPKSIEEKLSFLERAVPWTSEIAPRLPTPPAFLQTPKTHIVLACLEYRRSIVGLQKEKKYIRNKLMGDLDAYQEGFVLERSRLLDMAYSLETRNKTLEKLLHSQGPWLEKTLESVRLQTQVIVVVYRNTGATPSVKLAECSYSVLEHSSLLEIEPPIVDPSSQCAVRVKIDRLLEATATKDQVFDSITPMVSSVLNGRRTCILLDGQSDRGGRAGTFCWGLRGDAPAAARLIFDEFERLARSGQIELEVEASEIYLEEEIDVLSRGQWPNNGDAAPEPLPPASKRFAPLVRRRIQALESLNHILDSLFTLRKSRLGVGERSHPRSHLVCKVIITQNPKGLPIRSELCLVDLASGAPLGCEQGDGLIRRETRCIVKGRDELRRCIQSRRAGKFCLEKKSALLTSLDLLYDFDTRILLIAHIR
ncbi:hypothetical protein MBLNU459_g0548t3 [Dothideomycetes sp. NU459]